MRAKRIGLIIAILAIFFFLKPILSHALVGVHEYRKLAPKTSTSTSVVANGARYRFIVDIEPGGPHHPNPDEGFVYAKDGYKYQQSSIQWKIFLKNDPSENPNWGGADGGQKVDEPETVTQNNYLPSMHWQTPINDKTYTVKVSGNRWPYKGVGGVGPYDPYWESTKDASLTRPEIYNVYLKVNGDQYPKDTEVSVGKGQSILVEGIARDEGQKNITDSEVTVFWKLKDPAPKNSGEASIVDDPEDGKAVSSTTTDPTGVAKVWLKCSSVIGDDYIVCGQDRLESPKNYCDSGKAIVGFKIKSVVWEAIDSPLDTCPNNGGKRIFPGKQSLTDKKDRRKVRVKVTIDPPLEEETVYFKGFDVDDPSSDTSPVDSNGSAGDDNRGSPKRGTLSEHSSMTNNKGVATAEFTVTMQPGDNFKVVASGDQDYLNNLTVEGVNVKDNEGKTLPTSRANLTEMLTVWRRFHVERDSMGKVPKSGPEKNFISGNITDITGTDTPLVATTATVGSEVDDGSENLSDSPPGNGRFENGTIKIGSGSEITTTSGLDGNGRDYVYKSSGIDIPFTLTKKNYRATGKIVKMSKAEKKFTVDTYLEGKDYSGGRLVVCGVNFSVTQNTNTEVFVTDEPTLPYEIRDDDKITDLQDVPMPDTSDLSRVFKPAYVEVEVGDVGDNNDNVEFDLNVTATEFQGTLDWDSKSYNINNFWVVYILGGYQYEITVDNDPNEEPGWGGLTDPINGGCIMCMEVIHDPTSNPQFEKIAVDHEVGHLFGGEHSDGGLMGEHGDTEFTPITLDKIRSISKPIGN